MKSGLALGTVIRACSEKALVDGAVQFRPTEAENQLARSPTSSSVVFIAPSAGACSRGKCSAPLIDGRHLQRVSDPPHPRVTSARWRTSFFLYVRESRHPAAATGCPVEPRGRMSSSAIAKMLAADAKYSATAARTQQRSHHHWGETSARHSTLKRLAIRGGSARAA